MHWSPSSLNISERLRVMNEQTTNGWTKTNPYVMATTQTRKLHNEKCHVDNEKWICNQANGPQSQDKWLNWAPLELVFREQFQRSSDIIFPGSSRNRRAVIEATNPSIQMSRWIKMTGLHKWTFNQVDKAVISPQKTTVSFHYSRISATLHFLWELVKLR